MRFSRMVSSIVMEVRTSCFEIKYVLLLLLLVSLVLLGIIEKNVGTIVYTWSD